MNTSILKYMTISFIGLTSSNFILATEPVLVESPTFMRSFHYPSQNLSSVSVPRLFTIGTLDQYSPELTFDEIEIDTTNASAARETLSKLKVTPFKLDLLQKQYNPKDFNELMPYTQTLFGLNLAETQATNNVMELLSSFTQLRYLDLSDNRFDDGGFSVVEGFKELTELRFNYNNVTSRGFQSIRLLSKLEILDAGCTFLGNPGVLTLTNNKTIVHLNVQACGLDDLALVYFHTMSALKSLNLTGNRGITKAGIEKFLLEKKADLVVKYDQ